MITHREHAIEDDYLIVIRAWIRYRLTQAITMVVKIAFTTITVLGQTNDLARLCRGKLMACSLDMTLLLYGVRND